MAPEPPDDDDTIAPDDDDDGLELPEEVPLAPLDAAVELAAEEPEDDAVPDELVAVRAWQWPAAHTSLEPQSESELQDTTHTPFSWVWPSPHLGPQLLPAVNKRATAPAATLNPSWSLLMRPNYNAEPRCAPVAARGAPWDRPGQADPTRSVQQMGTLRGCSAHLSKVLPLHVGDGLALDFPKSCAAAKRTMRSR